MCSSTEILHIYFDLSNKLHIFVKLKLLKIVTPKQARIVRKYLKKRNKYLEQPENQLCRIDTSGCTRRATEVHHSGKKWSEDMWLDESLFIPCCNNCHRKVENSPELARELGIYNYKA